jgi:Pyruvate/2-oxoacid:ferredoxin oxidoreductase delta subunit
MSKTRRQMILVDEGQCDGCGNCVSACPEGALQVIDGKARVVRESYCDGLGACLGGCPRDALQVVEVEADAYDEAGVIAHLQERAPEALPRHMAHLQAHKNVAGPGSPASAQEHRRSHQAEPAACPGVQIHFRQPFAPVNKSPDSTQSAHSAQAASELRQWPVQLRLLPIQAPFLQDAALTLVADCVPFAMPDFHTAVLRGTAVAVGCPKLDDAQAYIEKVAQMLQANRIRSLTVVYMEVPCCRGLVRIAQQALALSGMDIPLETRLIEIGI